MARNAAASEGVRRLKRSSASSHAPCVPDDKLRSDIARSWVGTKPADYTEIPGAADAFGHIDAVRSNRAMQINSIARRWWLRSACATATALALSACANEPNAVAGQTPHHRDGAFKNNYIDLSPRGMADFMRWRFDAWRDGLPAAPASATPQIVPDLGLIQSNAKAGARMVPTVTWIGHATVLGNSVA